VVGDVDGYRCALFELEPCRVLCVGVYTPSAQLGRYVGEPGRQPVNDSSGEPGRARVGVQAVRDAVGLIPEPAEREFR
jgi:hypothetical protein